MVAYVPDRLVASWLRTDNSMALPLAVLAGVTAYLNGYAAIPLVLSLIDLGMPASTGLAFMLAGSVTSIPAAIAIFSLVKTRLFAHYLEVGGAGAFLAGLTRQLAGLRIRSRLAVSAIRTGRTNSALQMATLSLSFRPSRPAYGQAVYG